MYHEYYFCIPSDPKLVDILDKEAVRYNVSGADEYLTSGAKVPAFISFSLKGYSPLVDRISVSFRARPQIRIVYSEKERTQSHLLWMTPKMQKIDIQNSHQALVSLCSWQDYRGMARTHRETQVLSFVIKNEPSSQSRTAFWSESTGFRHVFIDKRVRDLIESNGLQDIGFRDVYLPSGIVSNNIFQLVPHSNIDSRQIVFGYGEKENICSRCGMKQYSFNDAYQLHLRTKGLQFGADLLVTDSIWGSGISRPLYLVTQRFYQLMKQNKLASNIHWDPVVLE